MIYISLGANLPSQYGQPAETLKAAVVALEQKGLIVVRRSSVWLTAPVPFDVNSPFYHNAVVGVETDQSAQAVLAVLLSIEQDFGRVRTVKNAPRLLDLDLIAYDDEVIQDGMTLIVPHPRMHERLFVLNPLNEINDKWVHPILGQTVADMVHDLLQDQKAERVEGGYL